jgi:hypothetical protein|tara:strand:- start:164 stop:1033 length:870 start_codon:yes stop_codon:yes gene_type:complete
MNDILTQLINQFMPFAQERIGFNEPPKLFLKQDEENASNPLGKTAFYNPSEKSVTLYVTGRHPKDILRSLGHELVHHKQNCDGKFEDSGEMGKGYAQKNPHLRQMETEANGIGAMCLRDFEDGLREQKTIYYEHLQKGEIAMSMKDWKNKELTTLLSEAWGFKFNTLQEFDEFNGTGELQEEGEEVEEGRQPRLSSHSGENSPTQNSRSTRDVSGAVPVPPSRDEENEEDESLEEGEDQSAQEKAEQDCARKKRVWDTKLAKCVPKTTKKGTDDLKEDIKTLLGKYIKG